MGVLLSELLVPGWADSGIVSSSSSSGSSSSSSSSGSSGAGVMIGLREVTCLEGEVNAMSLPCHSADPEIFFAEDLETIARAKRACGACPMARACLEGALSRSEPCGVWGGQLFDNGRVISQKRGVGRPRLTLETQLDINSEAELMDERVA